MPNVMKCTFPNWIAPMALTLVGIALGGCGSSSDSTTSTNPPAPTVVSGAGDMTPLVESYRAILGEPNNGGVPGSHPTGRREINWDGVPDDAAAPNFLPADF